MSCDELPVLAKPLRPERSGVGDLREVESSPPARAHEQIPVMPDLGGFVAEVIPRIADISSYVGSHQQVRANVLSERIGRDGFPVRHADRAVCPQRRRVSRSQPDPDNDLLPGLVARFVGGRLPPFPVVRMGHEQDSLAARPERTVDQQEVEYSLGYRIGLPPSGRIHRVQVLYSDAFSTDVRDDGHGLELLVRISVYPVTDFVRGLHDRERIPVVVDFRELYAQRIPRARRHGRNVAFPCPGDDQKRSHSVVLAGEAGDGIPALSRYDAFDLGRACVRSFGPESDDLRHAGHEVSPFRHKLYGHAHGVFGKEELFFEEELALVYRGAYVPSLPYGIGRQVYEYGSCYGGFLLRSGYSFAIAVEHFEPDVYVRIGFAVRAGESHDGLGGSVFWIGVCYRGVYASG